jgi:hypothetical protein
MDLYDLSKKIDVDINHLYKKFKKLFPDTIIYDLTVGLTRKKIEMLTKEFNSITT